MSFGNQLMKNFQSKMSNPRDLIIVIIVGVLVADFLTKGKFLGHINFLMYHVKAIIKAGDWKFIVIILLLLFKR